MKAPACWPPLSWRASSASNGTCRSKSTFMSRESRHINLQRPRRRYRNRCRLRTRRRASDRGPRIPSDPRAFACDPAIRLGFQDAADRPAAAGAASCPRRPAATATCVFDVPPTASDSSRVPAAGGRLVDASQRQSGAHGTIAPRQFLRVEPPFALSASKSHTMFIQPVAPPSSLACAQETCR